MPSNPGAVHPSDWRMDFSLEVLKGGTKYRDEYAHSRGVRTALHWRAEARACNGPTRAHGLGSSMETIKVLRSRAVAGEIM